MSESVNYNTTITLKLYIWRCELSLLSKCLHCQEITTDRADGRNLQLRFYPYL